MVKRLFCLCIALVLCAGLAAPAAAADAPTVTLVATDWQDQTLTVHCYVQNRVADQELTCLALARSAAGKTGSVLQAAQLAAPANGLFTFTLTMPRLAAGYELRLGGTGLETVKTVYGEPPALTFTANALPAVGVPAGILTEQLAPTGAWTALRGERPLAEDETLQHGDRLTGERGTLWVVLRGDVNGDGSVNAVDALWVLQYAVGKRALSDAARAAADVRQSGQINAVIALDLLKYAVGKLASL